eukprot:scaffold573832_cov31-Prasinocladus_malaysianus.AAC.1
MKTPAQSVICVAEGFFNVSLSGSFDASELSCQEQRKLLHDKIGAGLAGNTGSLQLVKRKKSIKARRQPFAGPRSNL